MVLFLYSVSVRKFCVCTSAMPTGEARLSAPMFDAANQFYDAING
jgi:hypothetical protein